MHEEDDSILYYAVLHYIKGIKENIVVNNFFSPC